jgi:hypothetical protein
MTVILERKFPFPENNLVGVTSCDLVGVTSYGGDPVGWLV